MVNYTIPQEAFDINNNSFFNTGCIDEINKITERCSQFKLQVIEHMDKKFMIALIILSIFIMYQLAIKYYKPKFSQSRFYMKYIDYRIDFVIIILLVSYIAYIFFM
jgi:hypothetical protein